MCESKTGRNSRPPRTVRKRTFRRVLLVILLVLAALLLCGGLIPVTRWSKGSGFVMTEKEVEIRPSIEGAIDRWLVRDGDRVEKGQLLIQLKDSVQRAAYRQAIDELGGVEAKLAHLLSRQSLDRSRRKEQEFRIKRELQLARERLGKLQKAPKGVFSSQEINNARLKVDIASSRLAELRLPRDRVMAEEIKVLRERIKAARKKVALHEAEMKLRRIVSPLGGIVYLNRFEPGEVVKPEHVLGQIFDRGSWIVRLKLPERDIMHVRLEQSVRVELAAWPAWRYGYIPATVSKILPVVTPRSTGDGVFYIEARIESNTDVKLNPGMSANAEIDTGQTTWLMRLLHN